MKPAFYPAVLFCALAVLPASASYAADPSVTVKIDKVILSTAGLADFEYRAHVDGDATLRFPVRLDQVDDILKSLVVFDAKGRLGGVTLPGRQPLTQAFRDLPFTQDQLDDPVLLLNAYQGAAVSVKTDAGTFHGTIIQVRAEKIVNDKGLSQTRYRLTLLTATGLQQFVLEDVQAVQFEDAKVREEISRALAAVRENATTGQRTLAVALKGEGSRDVALSYVVNAPVWKSAYRMVLPAQGAAKGLLQGSAVIENQTAGDWDQVDLTLVSGNPVTFRQALYQSYYVDRPEIPVQVFGRVMPKVDEGTLGTADSAQQAYGGAAPGRARGMMMKSMNAAPAPAMAMMAFDGAASMAADEMMESGGAAQAANSAIVAQAANAAESAEATSQVLFRFPDRFDLQAGSSLMVPFVSRNVPMQRVAVYQQDTHPTHPLAAVELENDGDTALPPGVLTLYEDSDLVKGTAFIGDAQLPAFGAGEKRLVPYALDGKTKIEREDKTQTREGRFSISQGVLRVASVMRHEVSYMIAAPEKEDRLLIIEAPKEAGYELITPDPKDVEVAQGQYRLRVPLKAGEKKNVQMVLEQTLWNSYGIADMQADQLMAYAAREGALDAKTRKAFEGLAAIRSDMAALDAKIQTLQRERQTIFQDQARVRENLNSLDGKSDIQQKYMDKLEAQEDRIAAIDAAVKDLQDKRDARAQDLKKAIDNLPVEKE